MDKEMLEKVKSNFLLKEKNLSKYAYAMEIIESQNNFIDNIFYRAPKRSLVEYQTITIVPK